MITQEHTTRRRGAVLRGALLVLAVLLGGVPSAIAQFALDWYTIDGGGEMFSAGGGFELSGTIGQPDAGAVMTGSDFELIGGFWAILFAEPEPIPGDLDGDGDVDLTDLARLLAAYGTCIGDPDYNPAADLDGSGCVDLPDLAISDLAILLSHYGEISP